MAKSTPEIEHHLLTRTRGQEPVDFEESLFDSFRIVNSPISLCLGFRLTMDEAIRLRALAPTCEIVAETFIPTTVPNQRRRRLGSDLAKNGSPLLAMVGRISAQKDPRFFTSMAAATKRYIPRARFVWIGDADRKSESADLKQHLLENGVRCTGWLDDSAVARAIQASTVLVHTAAWEAGVPMSVVESVQLGVPAVLRKTPTTWDWDAVVEGGPADVARYVVQALADDSKLDSLWSSQAEWVDQRRGGLDTSLRDIYKRLA